MMGDRYKAIKQKLEMDYDGCRFFMHYDGYKLKALHQKKSLQGQQCCSQETKQIPVVLLAFDKIIFSKRIHRKSSIIQ